MTDLENIKSILNAQLNKDNTINYFSSYNHQTSLKLSLPLSIFIMNSNF